MPRRSLAALAVFALKLAAGAQAPVSFFGPQYQWGPITITGVVPGTLAFQQSGTAPSGYAIEYWFTGTPPSACTFYPEFSESNINFYPAATASTTDSGPIDCTTPGLVRITNTPSLYFRLRVPTFTGGDATTKLYVIFVRGGGQ